MKLQEKRDFYKSEINNIVAQSYNGEQKQLACDILDNATENNIDALYTFITQRVKLGFTFDAAPEVNHNCVALCKRNNKLSFGTLGNNHKMIIGENYDALKNLLVTYTKNGKGLVDVIYIDPPYNTESAKNDGNDHKDNVEASKFIYRDKFTRNGWLNMMNERLVMARKLLTDNGVIFISIDDTEQAYLKVLCDEMFGEENFIGLFVWKKRTGSNDSKNGVSQDLDYILCYGKTGKAVFNGVKKNYEKYENPDNDPRGDWARDNLTCNKTSLERPNLFYSITDPKTGIVYQANPNRVWVYEKERMLRVIAEDKVLFPNDGKGTPMYKRHRSEVRSDFKPFGTLIETEINAMATKEVQKIFGSQIFSYPKSIDLLKQLINQTTNEDSIILDFFAGSGTTGQAVMELNEEDGGNRKCILVANNENNIGKGIMYERIFRVVNGKGTNGEKFTWTYSKDKPYLAENSWDVFEIEYNELKIDDFDKAEKLLKQAESEFKALNSEYENKGLDIYNQLASLNPYKKDGK